MTTPIAPSFVFLLACICVYLLGNTSVFGLTSPGALSSFKPGAQYIMLTFDNAEADRERAYKILSVLQKYKSRATFFISGSKTVLRGNRDIVAKMVSDGHEIGLHSHSLVHTDTSKLFPHLKTVQHAITEIVGAPAKFLRPQLGHTSATANQFLKTSANMTVVLWSIDAEDNKPGATVDSVVKSTTANCKPGDVIIFHCQTDIVVEALPKILEGMFHCPVSVGSYFL